MAKRMNLVGAAALCTVLASCSSSDDSASSIEKFVEYVGERPIGAASDEWLEMQNMAGEWEKTVLVFGYATSSGAAEECQKIAKALKGVNSLRDYRCVPANTEGKH